MRDVVGDVRASVGSACAAACEERVTAGEAHASAVEAQAATGEARVGFGTGRIAAPTGAEARQQPSGVFDAVRGGDLAAVRALLAQEPRAVNEVDAAGRTPLYAAVAARNVEMARLLIDRGAAVRVGDLNLRAPIHLANQLRDTKMIDLLLEKGAPIETRAIGAATPLIHASLNNDVEMSRFLIERGADIDVQCNSLTTPLYFAVLNGNVEFVDALVQAGAAVDLPDFLGRTPLHVAVRDGHAALVERLVRAGADLSRQDPHLGRSLLHLAAIEGHDEVVDSLLRYGEEVNARDRSGRTALDYARVYGHDTTAALLSGKGATGGSAAKPIGPHGASATPVPPGTAEIVKLQNGAWGVNTKSAFLAFGYSEVGAPPGARSLANGYLTLEAVGRERPLLVVAHDYHPAASPRGLDGSNPVYAMQATHGRVRFVLNAALDRVYASLKLEHAHYPRPGETVNVDGVTCRVFRSYGGHNAYVLEADGLTIVWLTGVSDNYVVTRRDTGVIDQLAAASVRPDILLLGSLSGIGPELAAGVRETYREGLRLGPASVVVMGHEPLERLVRAQLERRRVDTTPLRTADNPGDRFTVGAGAAK